MLVEWLVVNSSLVPGRGTIVAILLPSLSPTTLPPSLYFPSLPPSLCSPSFPPSLSLHSQLQQVSGVPAGVVTYMDEERDKITLDSEGKPYTYLQALVCEVLHVHYGQGTLKAVIYLLYA